MRVSRTPFAVPNSVVIYGLYNRGIVFRFRARARISFFLQNVPPAIFTLGVKRHTPPCNVDVKNVCNCASTTVRVQRELTLPVAPLVTLQSKTLHGFPFPMHVTCTVIFTAAIYSH